MLTEIIGVMSPPVRRLHRSPVGTIVVFAVAMLVFVAGLGALIAVTVTVSGENDSLALAARVRQGDIESDLWSVIDPDDLSTQLSGRDVAILDQTVPGAFGSRAQLIGASLTDLDGTVRWTWGFDIVAPMTDPGLPIARFDVDSEVQAINYALPLRARFTEEPVAVLNAVVVDPDVAQIIGDAPNRMLAVVAAAMAALWLAVMILTVRMLRRSWSETETQRRVAMIDPLTGLANRSALNERGDAAIAGSGRYGGHVGLVVVDLNRFKAVNDIGGHALGDRVLVEVARRLLEITRRGELAVRVGGDEFAVLAPTVRRRADLEILASRVRAALEIPVRFAGADDVRVTASVGTAWTPEQGSSIPELFRAADAVMYAEKNRVRRPLSEGIERAKARQEAKLIADRETATANAAAAEKAEESQDVAPTPVVIPEVIDF